MPSPAAFDRIDVRGLDGLRLKNKWQGGPQTFLGIQVESFPNLFMIVGPHTALGNIPRSIEYIADWITGLMRHMHERNLTRADARPSAVAAWTDYVREKSLGLLTNEVDSWMTGVNRNVEGKHTRILARYSGSAPAYRKRCDAVAARGYTEIALD